MKTPATIGIFMDPHGSGIAHIRRVPDLSKKIIQTLMDSEYTRVTSVSIDGSEFDIYHTGVSAEIPTVYTKDKPIINGPYFICLSPGALGRSLTDYHVNVIFSHIQHKRVTSLRREYDIDILTIQ